MTTSLDSNTGSSASALTAPIPQPSKPFGTFTPALTRGTLEDLMLDPNDYLPLGVVEIFQRDDKIETERDGDITMKSTRVVYCIYGGFGEEVISTLPRYEEKRLFGSLQALNEALISKWYVLTKFDEKNRNYHGTSSTHCIGDLYVKKR